jgi:hypothetical protein
VHIDFPIRNKHRGPNSIGKLKTRWKFSSIFGLNLVIWIVHQQPLMYRCDRRVDWPHKVFQMCCKTKAGEWHWLFLTSLKNFFSANFSAYFSRGFWKIWMTGQSKVTFLACLYSSHQTCTVMDPTQVWLQHLIDRRIRHSGTSWPRSSRTFSYQSDEGCVGAHWRPSSRLIDGSKFWEALLRITRYMSN